MRVLLIDSYEPDDPDRYVVEVTARVLDRRGNRVEVRNLAAEGFAAPMSAVEHDAYMGDQPLVSTETIDAAQAVTTCNALMFCYPTTLFGVPPVLKSWLERVLVQGVAFELDDDRVIRPAMTQVRRLGVVTTTPHRRTQTAQAYDLGRRTIMRTVRLNCHPRCRRTFVTEHRGATPARQAKLEARVTRRFAGWR